MLALDFINIGNGDCILIREMEGTRQKFALMVDFGHDCLVRDDHPGELDPRSQRIYAGDFLRELGVTYLDVALATHFHRDHIGGLSRVLDAVTIDRFYTTYLPPENAPELAPFHPDNNLPKAARNALLCLQIYTEALQSHPDRIKQFELVPGTETISLQLTPDLKMDILCGEPALYRRQKEIYDAAFNGERNGYELVRWAKSINVCSLRQRLYYHGKEIVLGGDAYAHVWETVNLTPCDILKVPHHASFDSTSRKLLEKLQPKTAVVTVAARRPDERPHPYVVSLLQEYVENLYFTDAVEIPGLDGRKMSKSYGNAISLSLTAEETAKLIKKSKTDADRMITYDKENRPGVSALLTTAALCTGRTEVDIAEEIGDGGSGTLKKYVTEGVNEFLAPIRERRVQLAGDMDYIKDVLHEGNRRANEIANATLDEVREAMNMVY